MSKLRVQRFCLSLDGYGAGAGQSRQDPVGVGGERLHEWMFPTRTWHRMTGEEGGATGVDDQFLVEATDGIGATIMGRNMFGPVRGPWSSDPSWSGWWGPNPPYHHPVFVLTHEPRESIPMEGGTVFHFVTDGIESALEQAVKAAGGQDVAVAGGVSTVKQYLRAGLVDSLHLPIVPVLLGRGERLLDEPFPGYECTYFASSDTVTHVRLERVRS
ncbi:dihydrofolate reductase family protein [Dactylosporangium sucinum]|uniref:DNA-binding protein n=1 Tax=Dactylosporangium sucinum TaxID=1424081 RepID=A0A917TIX4_9ACTN|nr:dihydrofolate reductase family protein [Dactylosporangium sucinum]GGM24899.1 DNA-binding protein [Dactylosporangium sucinum]